MVNAEQEPLRTQYADILRSRSRLSAEASSKADLVNTLMTYAQNSYTGRLNYLKTIMDIEEANKKAKGTGNITSYLGGTEPKPTTPPSQTTKTSIDDIFKGVTIDESGNIKTQNTTNQQFDKSGNLIIGGGIKLNDPKKGSQFSTSTKFNRLLNLSA